MSLGLLKNHSRSVQSNIYTQTYKCIFINTENKSEFRDIIDTYYVIYMYFTLAWNSSFTIQILHLRITVKCCKCFFLALEMRFTPLQSLFCACKFNLRFTNTNILQITSIFPSRKYLLSSLKASNTNHTPVNNRFTANWWNTPSCTSKYMLDENIVHYDWVRSSRIF